MEVEVLIHLLHFPPCFVPTSQRGAALPGPVAVRDASGSLTAARSNPPPAADRGGGARSQTRPGDGAVHGAGAGRGLGQQAEDDGRGGLF